MTRLAIVLVCVCLAGGSGVAQSPGLHDVLARVGDYHRAYAVTVSGVSLEERTQLRNVSGGQMRSVVRIDADVVLVGLNGQVTALRDPFAVDTRPLRPRAPRILQLLGAPATPAMRDWETASRYPQEAAHFFLIDIVVKVNEPTGALQFVAPLNQPGLKYRLDGRRRINGVETVGLRFEEPEERDRQYLLGTRRNARATGRVWVEPATGAIHQTELWVNSKLEEAIVAVKYAPHPELGMLLPIEMNNSYEERETGGSIRQPGDGAEASGNTVSRISVETRSTFSNATFAAIDLTRLRR